MQKPGEKRMKLSETVAAVLESHMDHTRFTAVIHIHIKLYIHI